MKSLPVIFSFGLWAVAACAKPAGGPLDHTFDNTRLASVAVDAKQPVIQAQQQQDLAQQRHDKAGGGVGNTQRESALGDR